MATGLGTPNAGALASALCADALGIVNPGNQVSTVGQQVSFQVATNAPIGTKLSLLRERAPERADDQQVQRPDHRQAEADRELAGRRSPRSSAASSCRCASFTWKVVGAPTVSQVSLSGVASGHPALRLTIAAGEKAPELRAVSIALPRGLSFGRSTRATSRVTGQSGRRVAFSSRLIRGRLQITLVRPAQKVRIAVARAAIKATGGLAANVRRHRGPARSR